MPKHTKLDQRGATRPRSRSRRKERHLSVRSELRREPDVKKLARAVVALALAQAEADAQAADTRAEAAASQLDDTKPAEAPE